MKLTHSVRSFGDGAPANEPEWLREKRIVAPRQYAEIKQTDARFEAKRACRKSELHGFVDFYIDGELCSQIRACSVGVTIC